MHETRSIVHAKYILKTYNVQSLLILNVPAFVHHKHALYRHACSFKFTYNRPSLQTRTMCPWWTQSMLGLTWSLCLQTAALMLQSWYLYETCTPPSSLPPSSSLTNLDCQYLLSDHWQHLQVDPGCNQNFNNMNFFLELSVGACVPLEVCLMFGLCTEYCTYM